MVQFIALLGRIGGMAASGGGNIGQMLEKALGQKLKAAEKRTPEEGAKKIANLIKRHFRKRFPGSRHFSPSKVYYTKGQVIVDVPGVNRAYRAMDIYPRNGKYLAIPVRAEAKGKSPMEFADLFKPKDHDVLAKSDDGELIVYYALSEHVHQRKDRTIMPSDEQIKRAGGDGFELKTS